MNITESAWLTAGLPLKVTATTIDTQCGSSQLASTLAYSLMAPGVVDTAVACGVEVMSKVLLGPTTPKDSDVGKPINRSYWEQYELTTQREGAERMAERCTDGKVLGTSTPFTHGESLRPSTLEKIAALMPTGRSDGVHTAEHVHTDR
jgi:acetyl-CoA C-acetyltransferase